MKTSDLHKWVNNDDHLCGCPPWQRVREDRCWLCRWLDLDVNKRRVLNSAHIAAQQFLLVLLRSAVVACEACFHVLDGVQRVPNKTRSAEIAHRVVQPLLVQLKNKVKNLMEESIFGGFGAHRKFHFRRGLLQKVNRKNHGKTSVREDITMSRKYSTSFHNNNF